MSQCLLRLKNEIQISDTVFLGPHSPWHSDGIMVTKSGKAVPYGSAGMGSDEPPGPSCLLHTGGARGTDTDMLPLMSHVLQTPTAAAPHLTAVQHYTQQPSVAGPGSQQQSTEV